MVFKIVVCVFSLFINCWCYHTGYQVDYNYASLPILFHMDNFDDCMLLEDRAFYCSFSYEIQPLYSNKSCSQAWKILKRIQRNPYIYRRDILRHSICVPKTCPNVIETYDSDPHLYNNLTDCYNKKFKHLCLTGNITDISCDTNQPKYPIDWWDIVMAFLFMLYLLIILIASLCEQAIKNKIWNTNGANETTSNWRKILMAFSVPRNWNRLTVIHSNPDMERLRSIQGLRFYIMLLIVLAHTIYILFISLPVSNINGIETISDRFSAVFFTSGPLFVSTFFVLSSFLLIHGIFEQYKKETKIHFQSLLLVFVSRYIRLTSPLAIIIAFQSTWMRHFGSGPNWNNVVGKEYLRCRKNGWTNIFYFNNMNPEDMCLHTTWYLALDTQYFVLMLVLIWFIKRNERYIWLILGIFLSLSMLIAFHHNYSNNFPAVMVPTPELLYDMRYTLKNTQWHVQYIGFFENMAGPILGLGVGYLYFTYKEKNVLNKNFDIWLWWIMSHAFCYGAIIIPGIVSLSKVIPRDHFYMALTGAGSRPIFALGISFGLLGMTQGVGWIIKWILEWPPLYILGRLTYTAYLVHIPLLLLRAGTIRSPVYFNEYSILFELMGTLTVTYLVAAVFTLLFEMPISELQKLIVAHKKNTLMNKKRNQ